MKLKENQNKKQEDILLGDQLKSESYLIVLKKENAEKEDIIKKQNSMIGKYKSQITDLSNEKEQLLNQCKEKENHIKSLNNDIEIIKQQNTIFKEFEFKLSEAEEEKQKLKENNEKLIHEKMKYTQSNNELTLKIVELEEKIRVMKEIEQKEKNKSDKKDDDVFLTGNNEIILLSSENAKLKTIVETMKKDLEIIKKEKEEAITQMNSLRKDKNLFEKMMKEKEESLNKYISYSEETKTSLDQVRTEIQMVVKELNESKKIVTNYQKEKYDLEEIILKQEGKIVELTSNIKKIINILQKKNDKLKENQGYVIKLEETIKDLNNEFALLKQKNKKNMQTEVMYLKHQIDQLQKENLILKGEKLKTLEMYKKKVMFNKLQKNNFSHFNSRNTSIIKDILHDSSSKAKKYISRSVPRKLEKIKNGNLFLQKDINKKPLNESVIEEASLIKKKIIEKRQFMSGGSFYNININNNFKPISLSNSDILMEKQEKEKIEEFKSIINKLVNDISY